MTHPGDPHDPNAASTSASERPCSGELISLCARRERQAGEERARRLNGILDAIHSAGVEVHNAVIARAELSVLNEVCKAAGLYFDLIDRELRACVLVPATLYGDSGGRIFGKEPLQGRVRSAVKDPALKEVLRALQRANLQVIHYRPQETSVHDRARCALNPKTEYKMAGVLLRDGELARREGTFCGWPLSFEGTTYLVFGYELRDVRLNRTLDLLAEVPEPGRREVWQRLELDLLRALIDPTDRHGRPVSGRVEGSFFGGRQQISRKGLLLGARQAVWRAFAEPRGLTLHAHIAALVDDDDARQAFLNEVEELCATQLLKQGGLKKGDAPITLDEVLSPYHCDGEGALHHRDAIGGHPVAVLLLDDALLETMELDRLRPIREAQAWARNHPDSPAAHRVECALITYRTELNLVATYGASLRSARPAPPDTSSSFTLPATSAILPNLRALFDARFMALSLAELNLPPADAGRLERGLATLGTDPRGYTLDEIDGDERRLRHLDQVGSQTVEEVRLALLELATLWRWQRCRIDPRPYLGASSASAPDATAAANDAGPTPSRESLADDLDAFASLFDEGGDSDRFDN